MNKSNTNTLLVNKNNKIICRDIPTKYLKVIKVKFNECKY